MNKHHYRIVMLCALLGLSSVYAGMQNLKVREKTFKRNYAILDQNL
jgi:hypothetical protein